MKCYGFNYYRSSSHNQNCYWYCRLRNKLKCKARAITINNMIHKIAGEHNHDCTFIIGRGEKFIPPPPPELNVKKSIKIKIKARRRNRTVKR